MSLTVVHLDDGREWRGGQHQVFLLATGLAGHGIRQKVICPPGSPLADRLHKAGLEVEPLATRGELDLGAARHIANVARECEADFLHAHTSHSHALAIRAHKRISRGRGALATRLLSTRRVDFPVAQGYFSRRKYLYPAQHYIAISNAVAGVLAAGGIEERRIDIVASGVPPIPPEKIVPREEVRREFGVASDQIAIVNVGALTDHKGHRYLIEAIRPVIGQFPNAKFWILGEGEEREALEKQIDEAGLADYIKLPGFVPDVRTKLGGFDLYVSSSHLEGLGTSILDAILAGLPVVAAEAGGVSDIIIRGQTGWLATPRNSGSLARQIILHLETPEDPVLHTAAAALSHVEHNFSAAHMVEGVLAVYRRLLDE